MSNSAIVVTGAGRGLGRAVSVVAAGDGLSTVAIVRDSAHVDRLADVRGIVPLVADVGDDACEALIAEALRPFGSVTTLINNAGIVRHAASLSRCDTADVVDSVQVHCLGALRATRACLPWLLAAKDPRIINVSSRLASLSAPRTAERAGEPVSYAYRIAKASQNMLSVCLQEELAPLGIEVLAVHPGQLHTRLAPSDADVDPIAAAVQLLRLATGRVRPTSGFVAADGSALPW